MSIYIYIYIDSCVLTGKMYSQDLLNHSVGDYIAIKKALESLS